MKDAYIYGLVDPRTSLIRYVGKSLDPRDRLKGHLAAKRKTHCSDWIRSLRAIGLEPKLVILEGPCEDWQEAERRWIALLRPQLTNHTDGGEGVCGWVATPEIRAKRRIRMMGNQYRVGHRHSPETLKKIAPIGRSPTAETREKIRAARKGWNPKPETLTKMSATWFVAGYKPWNKGKKGSQTAWNKGVKGVSDLTREKMREKAKNRPKASCVRCRRVITTINLERHLNACMRAK